MDGYGWPGRPQNLGVITSVSPCVNCFGALDTPVSVDLLDSWYFSILGNGFTTFISCPIDSNNLTLSLTNVPLATLVGNGNSSDTTRIRTFPPSTDYTSRAVFSDWRFSLTEACLLKSPEPTTQLATPHSPTMAML